ncbi:MAG: hypothetical protein JSW53_00400 [Candidatus Bathyarchaeota archaeon]|nr:MAG: hypothetical protein JSW53_00400 [Candidatus Bathyarchaeota archaeon]
MKTQWVGKSVDLSMLTERINSFFSESDFETTTEKGRKGHVIQATSKIPNFKLKINVEIHGRPNDFTVDFLTGKKGGYFSLSMIIGYLTAMFGGGYLVHRGAREQDTLERFENDFWRYTDMQVANLGGSASHLNSKSKTSEA